MLAMKIEREEEERKKREAEQEQLDLELARKLDMELNLEEVEERPGSGGREEEGGMPGEWGASRHSSVQA